MPLYVADYLRDTRKLTAAEHGAYLLLIMEYWTSGELPDDDRQLARIASMTPAEWRKARPNVQPFFVDGWKHKRIDAELARSAEISSKRSASAKLKHSNRSANAEQLDTHAGATSQPQSQSQESSLRSEKRARATRLPNDWVPSENDLAFATSKGLAVRQIETEALKFLNYWTSKSGQGATKTDWSKTWQNWILTATQGVPTNGRRTVQDAARDLHENLLDRIAAFDEPAPRGLRDGTGSDVVRLLPARGCE
jgi:uncharacterized protein YdaU (DUF1376 family)